MITTDKLFFLLYTRFHRKREERERERGEGNNNRVTCKRSLKIEELLERKRERRERETSLGKNAQSKHPGGET